MYLVSGFLGLLVLLCAVSIAVDVRGIRKEQRDYLDAMLSRLNEGRESR